MPLSLRRLAYSLALVTSLATVSAAADTRTAQLGGGFQTHIRCEGARLSYERRDLRSARLRCRPYPTASLPAPLRAGVEAVDLSLGEEMRLLCQGARLKTRRTSRNEMRATCVSVG